MLVHALMSLLTLLLFSLCTQWIGRTCVAKTNTMKKYTLQAEFKTWNGNEEHGDERDFLTYITDFETIQDAETRLKSLIVERMSSRYGWKYRLLNSSVTEFEIQTEEQLEPI